MSAKLNDEPHETHPTIQIPEMGTVECSALALASKTRLEPLYEMRTLDRADADIYHYETEETMTITTITSPTGLSLQRIESDKHGHTARIAVPDYNPDNLRDFSAGTFTESRGKHGILIRATTAEDLIAIGYLLQAAGERIKRNTVK